MRRYSVSDEVWAKIEPMFPRHGGKVDNRLFFDAVHWVAKSGTPWRDLPERFGKWNSVFSRFNRLAKAGLWQRIFEASAGGEDLLTNCSSIRARCACISRRQTAQKKQGRSGHRTQPRRTDLKDSLGRRRPGPRPAHHRGAGPAARQPAGASPDRRF